MAPLSPSRGPVSERIISSLVSGQMAAVAKETRERRLREAVALLKQNKKLGLK